MRGFTRHLFLGIGGPFFLAMTASISWASETIDLATGFTRIIRLDRPARTIAIGDPEIADAILGEGQIIVLTGKAGGMTNMIVLDEKNSEVTNALLRVSPRGRYNVVIRYGHLGRTYFCAPGCEPLGVVTGRNGYAETGAQTQVGPQSTPAGASPQR